ncbi:hypothetical protein NEISUBOT_03063 [Neisseria subflava NJ9703]|uniref:Uncharacterized protein n=1 Tax=Neisseria subflava NJ9703 TaxID=546268 RepID=A0A9W5IST7_NEISU|nr:hypothetical protein NEISUBOT_03063 [Neisseria subflava NJ9703]
MQTDRVHIQPKTPKPYFCEDLKKPKQHYSQPPRKFLDGLETNSARATNPCINQVITQKFDFRQAD